MSLFPALTGTASAYPLPNTAPTPAAGEPVRAEDVQECAQALLNQDAALALNKLTYDPATGAVAPSLLLNSPLRLGSASWIRQYAPLYVGDANLTLDSNLAGRRIIMLTAPAANRTLTLRQSTSPAPVNGDFFEVTVFLGTSGFVVLLQREGSADYVARLGDGVGTSPWASSNLVASVRVELVSSVWRLTWAGGGPVFSGGDS